MPETPSATVFLASCGPEQTAVRNGLSSVLTSAGMSVVPQENDPGQFEQQLQSAKCSVHILFPQYGPLTQSQVSLAKFQFFEAKKKLEADPGFKMIVWLPPTTDLTVVESTQLDFINEVRNNISKNMVFSNASSAIQLTDDIRSLMDVKEQVAFDTIPTDVFLISNQLDETEAGEIIEMLSDILPVQNLSIVQDSEMDYSEFCSQQIGKSKLAVVYFKESGDWALPFAQQVWKKIGGASSHTPILLIGDEDPETNMNKKFKAPKVISLIIAGELIPLEIKVNYDKVLEGKV